MMGKYREYIAHTRENKASGEIEYQYLIDHLLKVSKYCEEYASDFSAGYMGKYIGLLHDPVSYTHLKNKLTLKEGKSEKLEYTVDANQDRCV